jgi:hypothetical protein
MQPRGPETIEWTNVKALTEMAFRQGIGTETGRGGNGTYDSA